MQTDRLQLVATYISVRQASAHHCMRGDRAHAGSDGYYQKGEETGLSSAHRCAAAEAETAQECVLGKNERNTTSG
jgi:hypothetical protein